MTPGPSPRGPSTPAPPSLARLLREGTHDLHQRVERSGVMARLIAGRLDRPAYTRLLRALHPLYETLEEALAAHRAHPLLAPLHDARLARADALASDLRALHGARWREEIGLPSAARRYVRRLRLAARVQPALLGAHAYVRYLGDLHGGQILRRRVEAAARQAWAPGGAALATSPTASSAPTAPTAPIASIAPTAFYDFGDTAATAALIAAFRSGLDEAGRRAGPALAGQLVREARAAFAAHVRLFSEIDTPDVTPT